MSPEVTFFCYLVALVCFVLAAAASWIAVPRVGLLGLGLAFWVFVPFWAALEAL